MSSSRSLRLAFLIVVLCGWTAGASAQSSRTGTGDKLDMKREQSFLPSSQALITPAPVKHDLAEIKPPKTSEFYEGNAKEVQYEQLVDEEIQMLYKLSQQNAKSANRGEVWLRLGEQYVEKAHLVELREQNDYDKKLKAYSGGKTRERPHLNQHLSHDYNRKAVELYEWFLRDFPNDPKVPQALYFLGYNQFELGNPQVGEKHYLELLRRFPNSSYVIESNFALGEYYFENEQWKKALQNYLKVIAVRRARLDAFALYKSAWCFFRLGDMKEALKSLERVIRMSRASQGPEGGSGRVVNKVRLASEALKDYVPFYAEVGDPKNAAAEFERLSGDQKTTHQMLERLAYTYLDAGHRGGARYIFKQLISENPTGEKAAEYQYQIVLAYATAEPREFRKELEIWLDSFGPHSDWAKANTANAKLVADTLKLQETTMRNNVLQLHQTAQKSRAESAQEAANGAYNLYFKYFAETPQATEMQFFHAELLFDMARYAEAAKLYTWVAEKDPKGPYHEKSIVNTLLALEKDLPTPKEIEAKRGKSLEKLPLDPAVARFEQAALRYIKDDPKGAKTSDIQRRLGVLYYSYNHFDEAIAIFESIVREDPKSPNAVIAGNLLLDIYKLRNDMVGFAEKGKELLSHPQIANSPFGQQVRQMLEKANYLRADKLAETGNHAQSAKEFETFAMSTHDPVLATAARYKAAENYEKAGDLASASRMHSQVLSASSSDPKVIAMQNDSRNKISHIDQQLGKLESAAKQYEEYAAANAKDPKAVNGFYNAGVIYQALGESAAALRAYKEYRDHSKNADRLETYFDSADMERKRGNNKQAGEFYEQYINAGPHNEAHVIESIFRLADHEFKHGNKNKGKQGYQKVIDRFKRAPASVRSETSKFAGECKFRLAQDTLVDLAAVKFTNVDKQQAKAATEIKKLREKYISQMKEVIVVDSAPWVIAALASSGLMFDSICAEFGKIPTPKGYSPEEAGKYKDLIQTQVASIRNEAKNSYQSAIDKSQDLEVYTEWTKIARQGLANDDPTGHPDSGEETADTHSSDWMGL